MQSPRRFYPTIPMPATLIFPSTFPRVIPFMPAFTITPAAPPPTPVLQAKPVATPKNDTDPEEELQFELEL